METSAAILASLTRYLGDGLSVDEFEHGLPDGWNLDHSDDPDFRTLVLRVMGYLGEFRRGDLSEAELRQRFAKLSGWITVASITATEREETRPVWTRSLTVSQSFEADTRREEARV